MRSLSLSLTLSLSHTHTHIHTHVYGSSRQNSKLPLPHLHVVLQAIEHSEVVVVGAAAAQRLHVLCAVRVLRDLDGRSSGTWLLTELLSHWRLRLHPQIVVGTVVGLVSELSFPVVRILQLLVL